jgi:hypothetical protein
MKALLRRVAERTVDGLWGPSADSSTPSTPKNAQTTSPPQAMMQVDRETL